MANLVVYRTYPSTKEGYDPVMDDVDEALAKENLQNKATVVSELTGVSTSTFYNWRKKKTRHPRFATIAATFAALGYAIKIEKTGRFDLAAERREAKRWNLRQQAAKLARESRQKSRNGGKGIGASL